MMSWENFKGDIGGVVGLWLGLSFLFVIDAVKFFALHLTRRCYDFKYRKRENTES